MKNYSFRRNTSDRETAFVSADSLEEAIALLEDGEAEYEAEPENSGPWDSVCISDPEDESLEDPEDTAFCGFWALAPESLVHAARLVLERWESGDLAEAVRDLQDAIDELDKHDAAKACDILRA